KDQVLIDTWVLEGLERQQRFNDDPCRNYPGNWLFDPDESSSGLDPFQGPHLSTVVRPAACDGSPSQPALCEESCVEAPPLRPTGVGKHGTVAMRLLYFDEDGGMMVGGHGFGIPDPTLPFDYSRFQINQIGRFFETGGAHLSDDPCLEDSSCDFMP